MKYVNQREKRRTHGRTTKRLGLFTTGREMRLMTRKRAVLTLCAAVKCMSIMSHSGSTSLPSWVILYLKVK